MSQGRSSTPRVSAAVFDNPDARHLAEQLTGTKDLGLVHLMLGKVVGLSEYVELAECQTAVAAAAVVVSLLHPGQVALPEALARHYQGWQKPHRELVGLADEALEAVKRILAGLEDGDAAARDLLRSQADTLHECLRPAIEAPLLEQEAGASA
jgi:hypothetical protein